MWNVVMCGTIFLILTCYIVGEISYRVKMSGCKVALRRVKEVSQEALSENEIREEMARTFRPIPKHLLNENGTMKNEPRMIKNVVMVNGVEVEMSDDEYARFRKKPLMDWE